jgi:hypothetical protein
VLVVVLEHLAEAAQLVGGGVDHPAGKDAGDIAERGPDVQAGPVDGELAGRPGGQVGEGRPDEGAGGIPGARGRLAVRPAARRNSRLVSVSVPSSARRATAMAVESRRYSGIPAPSGWGW